MSIASTHIRINDRVISEEEINREMQYHPAPNPQEARRQAAVALSVRELLLAEADRLGIAPDEGESAGADEARIRQLLEQELETPAPSEEECRAWYDKNRERLRTPASYRVSHILRPAPPGDADARARARRRCKRILRVLAQRPERFGVLARRHSRCPSAADGGALGEIGPGQTCTEFERTLERLPVNEIAAHPQETRYGFHVVWLHERTPGRALAFEEARERIASYLSESVWRRSVSQYVQILAGQAQIRGIALDAANSPLVQ